MNPNDLLKPLAEDMPCGPNLHYDPEYLILFAKIVNRTDVQYGDFIEAPEPLNWSEIERECQRLLGRSKDINLLILLMRCRTRLGGAQGLYESMMLLWSLIQTYPEDIHPQLEIEGEWDVAVRAGALAMLLDPEGVLGDIRDILLSRGAGLALKVRDVERAFLVPRPADALAPESVVSQLQEMALNDNAALLAMLDVAPVLRALVGWAEETLVDYTPNFDPILHLLQLFEHPDIQAYTEEEPMLTEAEADVYLDLPDEHYQPAPMDGLPEDATVDDTVEALKPVKMAPTFNAKSGRKQALEAMRSARLWFEQNEPSSPVVVLLKQAERMVGKRFMDLVQVIPYELLKTWDEADGPADAE